MRIFLILLLLFSFTACRSPRLVDEAPKIEAPAPLPQIPECLDGM